MNSQTRHGERVAKRSDDVNDAVPEEMKAETKMQGPL
jgi:hypothetical protein